MERNWNCFSPRRSYSSELDWRGDLPEIEQSDQQVKNEEEQQRTGSWETLLPSMLNSSSLEQLASDDGMADRRLYLIKSRLRFFRFPIKSGKSISSLWVKSSVVNWAQLPERETRCPIESRARRTLTYFIGQMFEMIVSNIQSQELNQMAHCHR